MFWGTPGTQLQLWCGDSGAPAGAGEGGSSGVPAGVGGASGAPAGAGDVSEMPAGAGGASRAPAGAGGCSTGPTLLAGDGPIGPGLSPTLLAGCSLGLRQPLLAGGAPGPPLLWGVGGSAAGLGVRATCQLQKSWRSWKVTESVTSVTDS